VGRLWVGVVTFSLPLPLPVPVTVSLAVLSLPSSSFSRVPSAIWEIQCLPACVVVRRPIVADTCDRLEYGNGTVSPYMRNSLEVIYPTFSYPVSILSQFPWSPPYFADPDRQIALVQYMNVTQGVWACANNGNCTAPNLCMCAPGWSGFDCRYVVARAHCGMDTP
jgi:hypothetical protein